MTRNNIKLLTPAQLDKLNEKYMFEVDDDNIIVKLRHYNRITKHPRGKPFHINSKIRKVCFSMDAIELWLSIRETHKDYSLFDVQQAVNSAYITYRPIDTTTILNLLKNPTFKIQSI